MTIENLSTATREVNIETVSRQKHVDVRTVCSVDGFVRLGINTARVDSLISNLSNVLQNYSPDEMITGVGIMFVLISKRFKFNLPSYLGFIEAFLFRKGGDQKLGCHAFDRLLWTFYKETVKRIETIKLQNVQTVQFSGVNPDQTSYTEHESLSKWLNG